MSDLAESGKKVLDAITERVRNPFLFSFLIALVVHNYRFFLVLLSDDPYLDKLKYIDGTLYVSHWDAWWAFLAIPFVAGIVYTLGFPWLDFGIRLARVWFGNIQESRLIRLRNQEPIAEEEIADLHATYETEKAELLAELKRQSDMFRERNTRDTSKIDVLRGRLSRLAVQIAFADVKLDWRKMHDALTTPNAQDAEVKKAIRESPYFEQLREAFNVVEKTKVDGYHDRRIDRSAFGTATTPEDAWILQNRIEILIAFGLIQETTFDGAYQATHQGVDRFSKLIRA